MANKALKGLTIKIGGDTSDLTKSLSGVEKQSRSLSGELGQINKLLKLDPKNTELLAQKQKVLAEAIRKTEEKLDTLREAEKQVQKQFERGEVSEAQYRALQREIIETENKLNRYKGAAKETADTLEELAKSSDKAGKELDDQADKTKEAEEATEDLDDVAGDLAKGGLAAVAAAAVAAATAVVALAEESREYRTEMAKLDTAFQTVGHSSEAATKTYEALQSVVGETEQAVEAANHLAKLCTTEEELAEWTEILTGVYGTFGASLPIEGLTEAANETAKVGQVTGPLADALNWASEQGADFGVVLKENIKFTKLDKKELENLTDAQRAEYEAREKQYNEIEAYNKKVAEAVSAEDKFNIALENCSDEQERQQLITKTLTKLYGSAATQYKKTNKEVIRANEVAEKWNKATAKLGKTMDPVITDFKELGVAVAEEAAEPLEDLAQYVQKKVIPALKSVGSWVKTNIPKIKAGATGVAAAIVTLKVASVAATVAQKGLTTAIMATTVAQKALALAQAATPWGLVATAVVGVTVALVALTEANRKAKDPVDVLTKEERELMAAADEAAEAFREQKKATDEALAGITAQMQYTHSLAFELSRLADASGQVKEKDQERAQFILNELNEALGTEYKMVDGIIQQYGELETSIHKVIQAKLANSLVEAANADYVAAIQNESQALETLNLTEQDYRAQKQRTQEAEEAWIQADAEYVEAKMSGNAAWIESAALAAEEAETNYHKEQKILDEKKAAYDEAAVTYGSYYNAIANYEEAQAAVLSGNYQKAVDILSKKGGAFGTYSDTVDKETAKVLDALYKEAVDAGLEADRTKKNFENGVKGYTKEMVTEAEKGYEEAMDEFANAYADAEAVGEDVGDGFSGGMENKRTGLLAKARSLVQGVLSAMRKEADSNSPAQKTIDFGEDVGEGAEIGIERKTKDVKKAATRQASAIIDAYSEQEVAGQRTLRGIAEQQAARNTAERLVIPDNSGLLGQILTAIEKGQVLTIDGEALVGATANRMDTALGRRRALAARGAI